MADTNDRNQGSEHDFFDETAPRSIFAATWFRAVLVLIVLGVIGAVAVPYILDAMNAPRPSATAKLPTPLPPPSKPAPPPAAVTPPAPPAAPSAPLAAAPPAPSATTTAPPTTPSGPAAISQAPAQTTPAEKIDKTEKIDNVDKAGETKDALTTATTPPETPKAEPKSRPVAAKPAVKTSKPAAGRQWFVQVGAFKDGGTAKKVATKLREEKYTVDERGGVATVAKATTAAPSTSINGSADHYDVIVTGQPATEIKKRLAPRGLTAEAIANGAVVKPSLPLRDAVALSKDLAVDGLKVQVRRADGGAAATPKPSSSVAASGDGLYRVSVGGFADRATAVATLKELEAKGYKPFLTRR